MKKFFKNLSVLILTFMVCLLSGCMFLGPESPDLDDSQQNALDVLNGFQGVKACYRPDEYNFDNVFKFYAKNIITGLADIYGNHSIENNYFKNNVSYDTLNDFLNNSILYQITPCTDQHHSEEKDNIYYTIQPNTSWKWSFNYENIKNDEGTTFLFSKFNGDNNCFVYNQFETVFVDYQTDIVNAYQTNFIEPYSVALECVIYEILLGQTPTIFNIDKTSTVPVIQKDETSVSDYLTILKQKYNKKGNYVGFTIEDNEKLINYVKENVIGQELLNNYSFIYSTKPTDIDCYNNLMAILNSYDCNNMESEVYRNLSDQITYLNKKYVYVFNNEDKSLLKYLFDNVNDKGQIGEYTFSIFDLFPAVYIKDYLAANLFLNSGNNPMQHIPQQEYNSLVFMPNDSDRLSSIWLAFESTNDLTIRVSMRYYDNSTNTLVETNYGQINVKANKIFDMSDFLILDCKNEQGRTTKYNLEKFDNTGIIKTNTGIEKQVTTELVEGERLSDYYIQKDSKNNFGKITVLNQDKINNNYCEVVFDVVKNANDDTNKNYAFKVGILGWYID